MPPTDRFQPNLTEALASLPPRTAGYPSPPDWRDQVLYMLMPDRFSDGRESDDTLLDRDDLTAARPAGWNAQDWAQSGASRFQGGTLKGVTSKLDYLRDLGVTAIWLGPPWKQRAERDDYHGYAIQDYLDVDPRFGTREDLIQLVAEAHDRKIRVILDVIINHTGSNWWYDAADPDQPNFKPYVPNTPCQYDFGTWLSGDGSPLPAGVAPMQPDDGVWPRGALQDPAAYHRHGYAADAYGQGDPSSAFAEFRIADWHNRDLALTDSPSLGANVQQTIIDCWSYWLALTDCDGFRIDTFKHVRNDEGRVFCSAIRERAEAMGKDNFLLVAEVGGGDAMEVNYLTLDSDSLSAVLEIGQVKNLLQDVAGGVQPATAFFNQWRRDPTPEPSETSESMPWDAKGYQPASHRDYGQAFVYTLDDHDNVWQPKIRFATRYPGLSVPGIALLTLTLGIPCLYYGTEQALSFSPDLLTEAGYPNVESPDRFLREAMFGPAHPRRAGRAGNPDQPNPTDSQLVGFGPFGTSGKHVFDSANPTYQRVAAMLRVRAQQVALRRGRQYLRDIRVTAGSFESPAAGGLIAWSRVLANTEIVCVANVSAINPQPAADINIDGSLPFTSNGFRVLLDTTSLSSGSGVSAGSHFPVATEGDGRRYVSIPSLAPAEVMVLSNV